MIDQLTGVCVAAGPTWLVLDLSGFALKAWCTPTTAAAARIGESTTLHTHLVVREDSLTLHGFGTAGQRDAFEMLLGASGIGPKLAAAVMAVLSPADLVAAIRTEDLARLCAVPGIGRKGAQKLVIELKEKVVTLGIEEADAPAPPTGGAVPLWREQVGEGLQGLGWSAKDAEKACDAVADLASVEPAPSVAALMRAALNTLAK